MAKEEKVFPLAVNEARGETALWVADVPLVLAAEIGRLSAVSTRLQCKSLNDLFLRLSGVEAAATLAAIELLTVKGNAIEAITKIKLRHFPACADAFSAVLSHHFEGDEGDAGNAEAVDEAA